MADIDKGCANAWTWYRIDAEGQHLFPGGGFFCSLGKLECPCQQYRKKEIPPGE